MVLDVAHCLVVGYSDQQSQKGRTALLGVDKFSHNSTNSYYNMNSMLQRNLLITAHAEVQQYLFSSFFPKQPR